MRIPVDWLHEYVDSTLTAAETAEALTLMGLEVEEVEDRGASGSPVLDYTVMSNRGDCLSVIGAAREIAADEGLPLKVPSFEMDAQGDPAEDNAVIQILDADLCFRYAATIIKGIKIGPSPDWMAGRLTAAGMRPINNIVDITNYVMLETGQPLHAFDWNLLSDHTIVIRRSKPGEGITTLDGSRRALEPGMLAICDQTHPIAVAGVMGGADTEVTERTVNVLIESACFNGPSIRKTARSLGLPTEASYRFERGVDLGGTANAAIRAAELIRQIAGGVICRGVVDEVAREPESRKVTVRASRTSALLGVDLTPDECAESLRRLIIPAHVQGDQIIAEVPTFRQDIEQEADLIEEIGRVYGFNRIPATLITGSSLQGKDSTCGMLENAVRRSLLSAGLQEVVTHSIVGRGSSSHPEKALSLRNPLSEDVAEMRNSLIPGLARVLGQNFSRGVRDFCIFEIGSVFHSGAEPGESFRVGGCLMGVRWRNAWSAQDKRLKPDAYRKALASDFYQAKGIVEALLSDLQIGGASFRPGESPLWRRGHSADIVVNGATVGSVGEIEPELRQRCELKAPAFGFELLAAALMDTAQQERRWSPASRFPAVRRDLAVVVDESVAYQEVADATRAAAGHLLEEMSLLDIFRGEQVGQDKKSIALMLSFRSPEKTLTDDEILVMIDRIRSSLSRALDAAFRDI